MKWKIWWIAALCGLCGSCGGNVQVRSLLTQAEKWMFVQPDSALRIVRSIDKQRITDRGTLARYALRYAQALDRNQILVDSDSLAQLAAAYYADRGTSEQRTAAFYYLGRVYENAGEERKAVRALVKAEVFSRNLQQDDCLLRGLVCFAMGMRYYLVQGGLDKAVSCYRDAVTAFTEAGNYFNTACAYRELAFASYAQDNGAEAIENIRQAIAYFEKTPLPEEKYVHLRRLEQFYKIKYDTTHTLRERKEALLGLIEADTANATQDEYRLLVSFYAAEKNWKAARLYEHCAYALAGADPVRCSYVYSDLAQIESSEGNCDRALAYYRKYVALRDSVWEQRHFTMEETIEGKLEAEALQAEYEVLHTRYRYEKIITVLALLVAFGLVWQLVRLSRQWHRRFQAHQRTEIMRRDELAQRLTTAYNELKTQYDTLLEKQSGQGADDREARFIDALEMRLCGLKDMVDKAYVYQNKPAVFFNIFSSYTAVSPTAKKDVWADLQYVVNKKFGGIADYLRTHYPELTSRELDLCCLLCFGFSPAGICFIYGYDCMGSLYNIRSRLRHKLGLDDNKKLETFLSDLCTTLVTEKETSTDEEKDTNASLSAAG